MALTQDTIPLNTTHAFEANYVEGYTYAWWFTNQAGVITELESTTNKTEEYYWDTEGEFQILVQAKDEDGCLSEIIFKDYVVADIEMDLIISAGNDTTIGYGIPYPLNAWVSDTTGLSYLWEPADNLDDATILNPVFTPGETTTFILTVSQANGNQISDTVVITVSEIIANAGEDVSIEDGAMLELDGSTSIGKELQYIWTTTNGVIESGENTANPIVSSAGVYYLSVIDFYGSTSSDSVVVKDGGTSLPIVNAGNDTIIGTCITYQLKASVSDTTGLSYLWEPVDNLNDPTILNPVFMPGQTTTFILTVSQTSGMKVRDTVTIEVDDFYANAGQDFVMEAGTTALLDGTGSEGEQLKYLWSTENGNIESGQNTATAIIRSPGTYLLEIEDYYGCTAFDSVVVSLLTYAPVAVDDYDTTYFQTAVRIPVLDNDYDPDGELDPTSLSIQQYPVNGDVYINYDDYTLTYTPYDGFAGNDVFEYQICDLTARCDKAYVYVTVVQLNFFVPQAFTPNGDNINDFFEIVGIEAYSNNSINIVNRWGKAVYSAKNYGIDTAPKFWDGTWQKNGGDVPTGTYFYILDLGNGQKSIAGSVYIDR